MNLEAAVYAAKIATHRQRELFEFHRIYHDPVTNEMFLK